MVGFLLAAVKEDVMFGKQWYPEGRFRPERGWGHNWHSWCCSGALQVLTTGEHEVWLAQHPGYGYTINFANGSCARIKPGDQLWEALRQVAENFTVQVFSLGW